MHSNPQDVGTSVRSWPKAAHAHDVTVQLRHEKVAAECNKTRLYIAKIRKAGRWLGRWPQRNGHR